MTEFRRISNEISIYTYAKQQTLNGLTVVCETKWESAVFEMRICSLRYENL